MGSSILNAKVNVLVGGRLMIPIVESTDENCAMTVAVNPRFIQSLPYAGFFDCIQVFEIHKLDSAVVKPR